MAATKIANRMAMAMVVGGLLPVVPVTVAAADAPRAVTITMANMSYGRIPSDLKVGDVIVWTNRDTVPHSATARDHSFDVRVGQGQSMRMTLQKAGSIAIYCIYHPAMRGTLPVAPR